MNKSFTEMGGEARDLPPTSLSLLVQSRSAEIKSRHEALNVLWRMYWKPLYHLARSRFHVGDADAKDLVQGFQLHTLENDFTARFDPTEGGFRGFLATAFLHYGLNVIEKQAAKKRGGGTRHESWDVARDRLTASEDED